MSDTEQVKELVTPDIEEVKKAIELVIEFEKAKNISLISRKGRVEFSKIYQKEEARGRVRKMVEDTVKEEIEPLENKINCIDGKLNQLLRLQTSTAIAKIEHPSDDKLDAILTKPKSKPKP